MLIRTFFMLAMIAALAVAMVQATASLARADLHRRANVAAEKAFASAIYAEETNVANAITAGADPRALPSLAPTIAPTCASANAAGTCEFTTATAIASTTTQQIGTQTESSGACAPLCATDAQENDAVDEGRLSVHFTVAITGGSANNGTSGTGNLFETRDRYAIFRTMRVPPYIALVGTRDATSDKISPGSQEGDDGGTPSLTTIDVVYRNANTGASISGNAWQSRAWNDADAGAANWEP